MVIFWVTPQIMNYDKTILPNRDIYGKIGFKKAKINMSVF